MNHYELDLGESESIVLAIEQQADYLVIDEKLGRIAAKEQGLKIVGILGILIEAKQKGLIISVKEQIEKLQDIGFRLHPTLIAKVLDGVGE